MWTDYPFFVGILAGGILAGAGGFLLGFLTGANSTGSMRSCSSRYSGLSRFTGSYIPHNYQSPKPPTQVKYNGNWWRLEGYSGEIAAISFGKEARIIATKFVEDVRLA